MIAAQDLSAVVYTLCAAASAACALLLFWHFWKHRVHTTRLVFWTALSLASFAVSNALILGDIVAPASVALAVTRAATACLAAGLLLFGLIRKRE